MRAAMDVSNSAYVQEYSRSKDYNVCRFSRPVRTKREIAFFI